MPDLKINDALKLAVEAHKKGDIKTADQYYTAILKTMPNHPDANHNLGMLAVGIGKLEESIPFFKKAISANNTVPQYWVSLIDVLIRLQQHVEALEILETAKATLSENKKINELEQKIRKSFSTRPPKHEISKILTLFKNENIAAALSNIDKLLVYFPRASILYNIQGACYASKKDYNTALSSYKNALKIEPDQAEVFNNIGIVFKDKGDLDSAITNFKKAIELRENYDEAYHNLGVSYKDNGNLKAALTCFERLKTAYSAALTLECLYGLGDTSNFNKKLSNIKRDDGSNLRVAAVSAFSAQQKGLEDTYNFCKNPLNYIKFSHISKHEDDYKNFIADILKELDEESAIWEPSNKSTKKGYQTNAQIFSNTGPNISILKNIIEKEVVSFKEAYNNSTDVIFREWPKSINLNAWYVRLIQGGHQNSHIHPNGWVSGVVYLKTVPNPEQNEGAIEFGLHGYNYPIFKDDIPRKLHQPSDGDVILFPSSLFHRTIPVLKNCERCVIAFDLIGTKK